LGVELSPIPWGFRFLVSPQIMGDYVLISTTGTGAVARFSKVSGGRMEVSHSLLSLGSGRLRLGFMFESLTFNRYLTNATEQSINSSGIQLISYGVVVPYEF
jgi:hypothetical protein